MNEDRLSSPASKEADYIIILSANNLRSECNKTLPNKSYMCDICHKNIEWRFRSQHLKLHSTVSTLQCDVCMRPFSNENNLMRHFRHQHGDIIPNYICEICNKEYEDKRQFQIHCMDHTGERPYICDCGKTYKTRIQLKRHEQTHQTYSDGEVSDSSFSETNKSDSSKTHKMRKYKCYICEKSMKYSDRLQHLKLHSETRSFQCDVCLQPFMTKTSVSRHFRRQHGDIKPNYTCEICDQQYEKKEIFQRHCLTHTGERPYACDECDNTYTSQYILNTHRKRCHQEKKFSCEICGKKFTYLYILKNHFRIHTEEKPYSCDKCNKSYKSQTPLAHHIRTVHEKKLFYCNICSKGVRTKQFLKEHIALHDGKKTHECQICNKQFSFKRYLTQHLFIHTGLKPHKCNICLKSFARKDNLKTHLFFHSKKESIASDIDSN